MIPFPARLPIAKSAVFEIAISRFSRFPDFVFSTNRKFLSAVSRNAPASALENSRRPLTLFSSCHDQADPADLARLSGRYASRPVGYSCPLLHTL